MSSNILKRAIRRAKSNPSGLLTDLPALVYERIAPVLPRSRPYYHAGYPIGRQAPLGYDQLPDTVTKYVWGDRDHYESALLPAVRSAVSSGDDVCLLGAGLGVSTVVAAEEAKPDGTVQAVDAAQTAVDTTRKTVELNGVTDRTTIHHAVVGTVVDTRSDRGVPAAETWSLTDLPDCDVLVIDIDGAEVYLLNNATDLPAAQVVVEHHQSGDVDAQPDTVRDRLDELGFSIKNERTREVGSAGFTEWVWECVR